MTATVTATILALLALAEGGAEACLFCEDSKESLAYFSAQNAILVGGGGATRYKRGIFSRPRPAPPTAYKRYEHQSAPVDLPYTITQNGRAVNGGRVRVNPSTTVGAAKSAILRSLPPELGVRVLRPGAGQFFKQNGKVTLSYRLLKDGDSLYTYQGQLLFDAEDDDALPRHPTPRQELQEEEQLYRQQQYGAQQQVPYTTQQKQEHYKRQQQIRQQQQIGQYQQQQYLQQQQQSVRPHLSTVHELPAPARPPVQGPTPVAPTQSRFPARPQVQTQPLPRSRVQSQVPAVPTRPKTQAQAPGPPARPQEQAQAPARPQEQAQAPAQPGPDTKKRRGWFGWFS